MVRRIVRVGRIVLRGARRLSSLVLARIEARVRRRMAGVMSKLGSLRRLRGILRHDRAGIARAPSVVDHADERTIRRIAEDQNGGVSSKAGTERWVRGENPGGLHQGGGLHRNEGPLHQRPEWDEPQERAERLPSGARRVAVHRRGAA